MLGFRFYAAMPEERKSKSASKAHPFQPWTRKTIREIAARGGYVDCVAVSVDREHWFLSGKELMVSAIAGVFLHENSACCSTSVSQSWLNSRCTHIDEATARKLHPQLFAYLDSTS